MEWKYTGNQLPNDPYKGHNSFAYWAAKKMGYPVFVAEEAADQASVPDTWDPVSEDELNRVDQCITHYWNPEFLYDVIGKAPEYTKETAEDAYDALQICTLGSCSNDQWEDTGKKFGYSTHYLTDVGNPMHTGRDARIKYMMI